MNKEKTPIVPANKASEMPYSHSSLHYYPPSELAFSLPPALENQLKGPLSARLKALKRLILDRGIRMTEAIRAELYQWQMELEKQEKAQEEKREDKGWLLDEEGDCEFMDATYPNGETIRRTRPTAQGVEKGYKRLHSREDQEAEIRDRIFRIYPEFL